MKRLSKTDTYKELLEIIQHQGEVIEKQRNSIYRLLHENAEQENMINVMTREHVDDAE